MSSKIQAPVAKAEATNVEEIVATNLQEALVVEHTEA